MDYYACPICKTKNDENQKYCVQCGHWMLSTTHPAQKVTNQEYDHLYICAHCDTVNEPERTTCKKCFKPLFSSENKAKVIKRKSKSSYAGFILIAIIVVALIGFFKSGGELPNIATQALNRTVTFDRLDIGDTYTVSQLKVNVSKPSAAADLTVNEDTKDPLEITAVFYDDSGGRLGKASALVSNAMNKGHTTTIDFVFDEHENLGKIRSVRLEIATLSPLMLIERTAKRMNQINSSK